MDAHRDPAFVLGLDYGTASVRALLVDARSGEEVASATWAYAHGEGGVLGDAGDPQVARQHPADHVEGLRRVVRGVLEEAAGRPGFRPEAVAGIGVDTTGSTPLPVDREGMPLALRPEFHDEPAAMAWLWKDHSSHAEAAEITDRAQEEGRPYLAKCGGAYSSEWYWAKLLRLLRRHPEVAAATWGWVELCDWVPAFLTGRLDPATLPRGTCAAGHKAMWHPDWGGLPAAEFLAGLDPRLPAYRERYAAAPLPPGSPAGPLRADLAAELGLRPGIPVAAGALDAHMGAVGAGIRPGVLVKILGTSTCDCIVTPLDAGVPDIPGVAGIVPESILPGMLGIEAGQAAVGDIFQWFLGRMAPGGCGAGPEDHARMASAAARLRPGQSGLVALDWHNGNRNVLADPLLTGLVVGLTLHTTPPEIYRALVEATAFGARKILDRLEEFGVRVEELVACGGIAGRSAFLLQVYADILERPIRVARSAQASALGAAVCAAVAAGLHPGFPEAQAAMTGVREESFVPDAGSLAPYRRLYRVYTALHDAFGGVGEALEIAWVMKELHALRSDPG